MKIVNSVFQILVMILIAFVFLYSIIAFDSAFEADQACHSYLSNFENQSGNYGCDHDTETHQWILYNDQEDAKPASVIKKFRYKFL